MDKIQKANNTTVAVRDTTNFLKNICLSGELVALEKFTNSLTIEKSITAGTQLSTMRLYDGEGLLKTMVVLIEDLLTFYKRKRTIETEDEIVSLAAFLINSYWWLKVEEVAYIFRGAKFGKYGRVLDAIDKATIVHWFEEYESKERENFIIDYNKTLQKATDNSSKETANNFDAKKFYEEGKKYLDERDQREKRARERDNNFLKFQAAYYAEKQAREKQEATPPKPKRKSRKKKDE